MPYFLKVTPSDELPKKVCFPCLNKVQDFYSFFKDCQAKQKKLLVQIASEGISLFFFILFKLKYA